MKTYLAKNGEIAREYVLFDASEAPVGRLAVRIANALRGKDKPTYTPHIDTGAFVIVINASKAVFTGRKAEIPEDTILEPGDFLLFVKK